MKHLIIVKIRNYMDIRGVLLQRVIDFFDEMSALLAHRSASDGAVKNKIISNKCPLNLATQESAEQLHKPIIKKFEKLTFYIQYLG